MEKFEKIVKFKMPFDKRNPDPKKDYGIGGMNIWFILKGKNGAVQVMLGSCFYLPSVVKEYYMRGKDIFRNDEQLFVCYDVGFHAKKRPNYLEKSDQRDCDILDCKKCYYDGSGLRGRDDKVAENFMEHGEKWVWEYLEKYYHQQFGDK